MPHVTALAAACCCVSPGCSSLLPCSGSQEDDQLGLLAGLLDMAYFGITQAWADRHPGMHPPTLHALAEVAEQLRASTGVSALLQTATANEPLPGPGPVAAHMLAPAEPSAQEGTPSQLLPSQEALDAVMGAAQSSRQQQQQQHGSSHGMQPQDGQANIDAAEHAPAAGQAIGGRKRGAEGAAEEPDQDRRKRRGSGSAANGATAGLATSGSIGSMVNTLEQQVMSDCPGS